MSGICFVPEPGAVHASLPLLQEAEQRFRDQMLMVEDPRGYVAELLVSCSAGCVVVCNHPHSTFNAHEQAA
jgi:hypothetical protein